MRSALGALAGLYAAISPVVGSAAPLGLALSLHDRIVARYDGTIEADPVVEMANDLALIAELDRVRDASAEDRARTKMLLGLALTHAQKFPQAVREVDAGVALLSQDGKGQTPLAIEMMMNAASFVGDAGDRNEAARRLDRVLALQIDMFGPNSSEAGFTYGFIGYNAQQQGRLAYAIAATEKALALMRPDPASKVAVAATYESYAHSLGMSGRTADYLRAARVAVRIAQTTLEPGQRGVGLTLTDLASALRSSGRYAESEAMARQALAIDEQYRGRKHGDTALALALVADALAAQGRSVEAETLLLEAADIRLQLHSTVLPKEPARALIQAAALARSRGAMAAARERLARAFSVLGSPTKGDELLRFLGEIERARELFIDKNYAAALAAIDAGLAGAGELAPTSARRVEGEMLRAIILSRLGRTSEAIDSAMVVGSVMEASLLDDAIATGEVISRAPAYAQAFGEYAAIALLAGQNDRAFRAIQLANLSELAVTNSAVAARSAASDPALAELVRKLQDAIGIRDRFDHERSFALGRSASEVVRLDSAIAGQDRIIGATSEALDARFPQYKALARPRPTALADVVARLPGNAAVLAPVVLDDSVIAVAVTAKGLTWRSTAMSGAAVDAAIGAIRAAVEPGAAVGGFPVGQAALLHHALLPDQFEGQIGRRADLMYFGGGALSRIPLAVLVAGHPTREMIKGEALRSVRWLVRDHSVETIVSFAAFNARSTGTERTGFAGIGAPILAAADVSDPEARIRLRGGVVAPADIKTLPSLPGAASELRRLRQELNRTDNLLLIGADASERRVKSANFMPYAIIAFATHGVVAGEGGDAEPALVLTPPDKPSDVDDGLLTASEVARLRLDAEWVILSNCDSAGAGNDGAAPFSGLGRAFFQAGARALLVSMWPVRDDAAEQLSVRTVDPRQHQNQARALQAAELATMADRSLPDSVHPAIWAPFVVLTR
jgi:CHAT domain-containing protein/tetratricopeptide (TPR) repeat protein